MEKKKRGASHVSLNVKLPSQEKRLETCCAGYSFIRLVPFDTEAFHLRNNNACHTFGSSARAPCFVLLQRTHESVPWPLGSFRMLHVVATSLPIPSSHLEQASPIVKQKLQHRAKKHVKKIKVFILATSIPVYPEQQARETSDKPGSLQSPDPDFRPSLPSAQSISANGKWPKDNESALHKCEPLPLPMAYPGSTPAPEDVETMKNCNPEVKDCGDVIYQWTGECCRCQGAGEASYYRKKGREVICKCVICLGLGHVHKVTLRTDIDILEEV